MINIFDKNLLKKIYIPPINSKGEDNGQVTIIGGSSLFHGAPILSLKVASRLVDMVFFATPEKSVGMIAESIKSKLMSFIWIPWKDVENYVAKSDAVLLGPGFLRFKSEKENPKDRFDICDDACQETRAITKRLLGKFPEKKWVIDAGSLQTMEREWIPKNAILTPNRKEYKMLFGRSDPGDASSKYSCTIVIKGPTTCVYSSDGSLTKINGGNAGLTKGGTGDVQAGLTTALLAKNDPFISAAAGSYLVKRAAEDLYKKVGSYYNSDDLAKEIPLTLNSVLKNSG